MGRGDGDASDADAVLVAVPRTPISAALGKVTGLEGKVAIDATNSFPSRHGKFGSYAEDVKNFIRGPVANMHVGALLELASEQRVRSSNWCVADDDARDVVERLIRDAGHNPWSEDLLRSRDFLNMGIEPVGGVF